MSEADFQVPWIAVGEGPPVVLCSPLGTQSSDWQKRYELKFLKPLADEGHRVISLKSAPRLAAGISMKDMANGYAEQIRRAFDGPVDVAGISTGGVLALSLALDHAELVRRLVLVASGPRLSPLGREVSGQCADLIAAGRLAAGQRALAPVLAEGKIAQAFTGLGLFVASALTGARKEDEGHNMVQLLRAEAAFDAMPRAGELRAKTLYVAADRDRCYALEDVQRFAADAPDARVIVRPGGHVAPLRVKTLWKDPAAFLRD